MAYEEIARRTIPQIMAILDGACENISIKLGLPVGSDSTLSPVGLAEKPPSLGQFAAFSNAFSGI